MVKRRESGDTVTVQLLLLSNELTDIGFQLFLLVDYFEELLQSYEVTQNSEEACHSDKSFGFKTMLKQRFRNLW